MNEKYGFDNITITKQAFSKQRQWLDPQIFMDIIHTSLTNLYSDCLWAFKEIKMIILYWLLMVVKLNFRMMRTQGKNLN
ncbi:MAG: hypothetical protein LBB45_01495 [Methanobrevibacter sp.]|jgi:hypothetical protein|nr:hypothetical protein [Candidatus Methanovirga basalitermitum]